jgi:hypothetical protein
MDTKRSHLFNTIEMDQWLSFADRATRGMRICLTMTTETCLPTTNYAPHARKSNLEVSSLPTTTDLAHSKEKATAEPVQIKPLISGRKRIVIDTTNTKERTEQGARKKGTPFLVEVDLRDYFAATAMQAWLSGWPSEAPHPASTDDKGARIAKLSYAMADAMIQARNMGNENEVK